MNIHAVIVRQDGVPKFAKIPIEEYYKVRDLLEDLDDLAAMEVARTESFGTVSLAEAKEARFGK